MNAVQRFIRSRVLLLTASILIVAMCLSVLVQGQSQAALNRTVDQNSRGLYDILVQAKADDNGGLMQPDIATGQGGISFEQLDTPPQALRHLRGRAHQPGLPRDPEPRVSAAGSHRLPRATTPDSPAPPVTPRATDPSKWPAAESVLSDTPKKYRLTASAVSSDGQLRSDPVQDHGRRLPRQGQARRRGGCRRQERPHRGPRRGRPASSSRPRPAAPSTTSSTSPSRCPWPRR